MISQADQRIASHLQPTVWGLDATLLHDRFWAARGVQVVRHGDASEIVPHAELFLLTDMHSLTLFRVGQLVDTLNWLQPRLLLARLRNRQEHGYRERVITDEHGRFLRFERVYGGSDGRVSRAGLTPDPELAKLWQNAADSPASGWRQLRESVGRARRITVSIEGGIYDRAFDPEVMQFIRELIQVWRRPDATIRRARRLSDTVWADHDTPTNPSTRFIGPVWIGAGRHLDGIYSVVGPAVLWDEPKARPQVDRLQWQEIEPTSRTLSQPIKERRFNRVQRAGKRLFDLVFALGALSLAVPILYPLVMLAIWLEDGRPFFFAHRRETMGGRQFPCLKFRTMRKDAEQLKAKLAAQNEADGPQFFIQDDPRLTRVGRFIRRFNIDELPQFFNVLVGHMSVIGPRPSPRSENQFCPAWRETRLSIRPGITGMWQVLRSRKEGLDFQEWIRYDIDYVENLSWRLDAWILFRTILKLLGRKSTRPGRKR